jgi:hypothetical protein
MCIVSKSRSDQKTILSSLQQELNYIYTGYNNNNTNKTHLSKSNWTLFFDVKGLREPDMQNAR